MSMVVGNSKDIWGRWVLHRRDADDPDFKRHSMEHLRPIRERVLDNAMIKEGDTLLDVGCGDGLIAFGALERTKTGKVIFSDISQELLDHCQSLAEELGVIGRCQFSRASADDLSLVENASVTVVTTRSVLIYVEKKAAAFNEFYRVLVPGGRYSLFEPINRFGHPSPDHLFLGYDVTPVLHLARKVRAVYEVAQPVEKNPMLDFDERDLLRFAEEAGFNETHLRLEADIEPPRFVSNWEEFFRRAPNPLAPTLEEAISQSLTPAEEEEFVSHLRPLVEGRRGKQRMAVAFLWGQKGKGDQRRGR